MTSAPAMLALVTDAFGGHGGIAQYNRDFLRALADPGSEGMAVSPITVLPRHAPDQAAPPVGIQQMPQQPSRVAYTLNALALACTRQVDLVFCGHLYMAPLAAAIARLKGAKLVVQTHGIEAWPQSSRLQRAALEQADLVLCVSRYTRAAVLRWAAIAPERVLVLPNTVDEAFTPGDGAALRAKWGLEGKRVLLTVGRMDARERYKGHDRVIRALPHLVAAGHDVIYVVVGEGDDVARLEALAIDTGVADRLRFVGAVSRGTLVDAYRMADLFVMPSTGEGFGIAFIEAMASGTPALGLALAGARDALADGELGITASEADLAATMTRLLARPKADPNAIAAAVRARFGRGAFAANACGAILRLLPVPSTSSLPAAAT
jgi:phosphatidylinositol alpha-1,6-mannosyltransferase